MPRVQLGPINSVELCEVSVWCELDWPIALRSVLADNANNKPSWVGINMWGLGWRPAGRGVSNAFRIRQSIRDSQGNT